MLRIRGGFVLLSRLGHQTMPFHAGSYGLSILCVYLLIKVKGQTQGAATALADGKGLCQQLVQLITGKLSPAGVILSTPPSMELGFIQAKLLGRTGHSHLLRKPQGL